MRDTLIRVSTLYEAYSPVVIPFKLYLSSLPSPLLPMSNRELTQFALRTLRGESLCKPHPRNISPQKVKTIIKSIPARNINILRDLCDYVRRVAEFDSRATRAYGVIILRASSDLMGEFSNEVGLLCQID